MFSRYTLVPSLILCLIVMGFTGCSNQCGGRYEVTGRIVLEGKPLSGASISFHPLDKQDTQSGGPIENGEYKVPCKNGLKPGKYLVRITAGDGKTPDSEEGGQPGGSTNIISVDRVPEAWNTKSQQQVEVKSDGPNKFDFDIPKANTARKR